MRITIDLDMELVRRAREMTGIRNKDELANAALRAIIENPEAVRMRLRSEGTRERGRSSRRWRRG